MKLFNFWKKKTEKTYNENGEEMAMCGCGSMCKVSDIEAKKAEENNTKSIKVLGSSCTKCKDLEIATIQALKNLNINEKVEHVSDFAQIASFGVMTTPALVIDNKVVSYGKVLSVDEISDLLKKHRSL